MTALTQKLTTAALGTVLALAGATAWGQEPIKIGFVGGLSGACGQITHQELSGMKMAVADINSKGGLLGRQIDMLVRDGKTRPDDGAKAARELTTSDKVVMLTGMCSSAVLLSTIPVANEAKIPILAAVANTQKANLEDFSHYFIQTQANAMQEAAAAAQFVAHHKNWKKVAVAAYDYEWGQTSSKVFTDELRKLRPDVHIDAPMYIKLGESNMTSYITALMARQPDVIFAVMFGGGLNNLVKQGDGYGLFKKTDLVTLTTYDFLMSAGSSIPPGKVHGIARAPFNYLMKNPKAKDFITRYKAANKTVPTDWAINGYDTIMFWAKAVGAAASTNGDKVIAASHKITYDGLRADGLKVRALDGQMNTPSYVGTINRETGYDFPVLTDVTVIEGDKTMLSPAYIKKARAAAKK